MNLTKAEALEIIRRISGPPRREILGEEYDHLWLILQFLKPFRSSNNQRTETDEYKHAGKLYHVTYGFGPKPMIEEIGEFDS